MSALPRFARGLWHFIVGDDWVTAAGVVLTVGLVAALTGCGVAAWWVTPVGLLVVLAVSLRRAREFRRRPGAAGSERRLG